MRSSFYRIVPPRVSLSLALPFPLLSVVLVQGRRDRHSSMRSQLRHPPPLGQSSQPGPLCPAWIPTFAHKRANSSLSLSASTLPVHHLSARRASARVPPTDGCEAEGGDHDPDAAAPPRPSIHTPSYISSVARFCSVFLAWECRTGCLRHRRITTSLRLWGPAPSIQRPWHKLPSNHLHKREHLTLLPSSAASP